MTIKNGSKTKLSESAGTLPDVSGAMQNWFQKMTFVTITRSIVNFRDVDVKVEHVFQGVIQPYSDEQLQVKPYGERSWKWHTVHAESGLELNTGDEILYLGLKYRVMSKGDYDRYGYVKYELVEGYQS